MTCPDCGLPEAAHLSADECEAHGIDTRDGLGCAVIIRALLHARCDYPGCLGPADGSECRHPRPEDG